MSEPTDAPVASRTFIAGTSGMKTVAALMNDPNPIHWSVDAVRAAGLGDKAINQGPITVSFLMTLALQLAGPKQVLHEFNARFLSNVKADDEVLCQAWEIAKVNAIPGTSDFDLLATVNGQPVASASCVIRTQSAGS